MVILPQLLYLFLNIPDHPEGYFFKTLRSEMIRLVWGGGKQPRLQWDILTGPYEQGGFNIPNFELYYTSAQAHYVY